ncbi:hypothetical protein AYI68_g6066 [Smittium mucronatum]|uniref:DUF7137 domain-containing protein n=1 Tax=Smittium mucronatum TaxID=133383 RepID=A0A1R0GSG4_9FUNG|nr:hypothetical protein AYI68_g6066 [Smittium mucronatum]
MTKSLLLLIFLFFVLVQSQTNSDTPQSSGSDNQSASASQQPSGTPAASNQDSKTDDSNNSDTDINTETDQDNTDQEDPAYTGQPGRIVMITPLISNPPPMFEVGSDVTLEWKYDQYTTKPPSKLMIIGRMPSISDYTDPSTGKPYTWVVANNISTTKYIWDTNVYSPKGISLRAGSGYQLTFYDGDLGVTNGTVVNQGRIINSYLSFSFYISNYNSTNDGIPVGYNPSSASLISPKYFSTILLLSFLTISLL